MKEIRKKGMLLFAALIFVSLGWGTRTALANSSSGTEGSHENNVSIYIAGDSTASYYGEDRAPRTGWAQVLDPMFDKKIVVQNHASSGRSSKSFIDEGKLDNILAEIKKKDYLFIQFGHNDSKSSDPARYTEPFTTYKSYLKQYIDGAREKGAIPVLLTSVERRGFTEDGQAKRSHGEYPEAMKQLGSEEQVPVIDMSERSIDLYNQLGPEGSKDLFMWFAEGEHPNYPEGVSDNTHFQENGAKQIAELVAEEVYRLKLPLLHSHLSKELKMKFSY
ncbi:Lysophospholipase L1 [Halobacillus dabanensis]|uniref:Lysophospholipase L1 n=1 Tax=Halobacillus dabanensis TaxID=240302 RepID=A0A1I3V5Q1_HALDA|nr:rhamnogalacturonan acetylesterase [Halobacillus dabanensis]SFJ89401.1 Lysophospholipase L1 [Halobacillus dabanensis]